MEKNIESFVINILKSISYINEININTKLSSLNLEDIDFTEIAVECEDEFEISLDELHMEKLETVKDLLNYIENEYKYKE